MRAGPCVALTRDAPSNARLLEPLHAAGFETLAFPCFDIEHIAPEAWASVLHEHRYDAMLFGSPHAARVLSQVLAQTKRQFEGPAFAIGPTTQGALSEAQFRDIRRASQPRAEALVEDLVRVLEAPARVLWPTAAHARRVVPSALARRGFSLDAPHVYRMVERSDAVDVDTLRTADVFLFYSKKTLEFFLARLGDADGRALLQGKRVVVCGPVTRDGFRALGVEPCAVAEGPSNAAVIAAIRAATEGSR